MAEVSQNVPLNAGTEELSIVDKYFSLKKEQRINRMQFFVRNITGTLLGILPLLIMGLSIRIGKHFGLIGLSLEKEGGTIGAKEIASLGIVIFSMCVICYILTINNHKRAHDLNHKGFWYIIPFISIIVFYIGILGLTYLESFKTVPPILSIIGKIVLPILSITGVIGILITGILLQFRKGNPGNNQYGPASTGKPLV